MNKLELQKTAVEVRKGIVEGVHSAKAGHPGGSLSAADIFTYLFFEEMNIDPKNPKKADRDRFVLSKGHTAPGYYAALALRGFFPIEDMNAEKYTRKCADSSVCHIFEKILKLKDLMLTDSGKEESKNRHQIVVDFLYHLFNEENDPEWIEYLNNYLK